MRPGMRLNPQGTVQLELKVIDKAQCMAQFLGVGAPLAGDCTSRQTHQQSSRGTDHKESSHDVPAQLLILSKQGMIQAISGEWAQNSVCRTCKRRVFALLAFRVPLVYEKHYANLLTSKILCE